MVSGLRLLTYALFRLAFTSAPRFPLNLASTLNSPVHSSIGTPSLSYGASTACRHTVSGSFSLRSPGSFHLSLTVLSAIGRSVVFSLGWWSTLLPTRFLVSRGTLDPCPLDALSGTRVSLSLPQFPICFPLRVFLFLQVRNPSSPKAPGLGSSRFARRYLGNLMRSTHEFAGQSVCLGFPPLRCHRLP